MLCKKKCESHVDEKKEKIEYKIKEESLIIPNNIMSSDKYNYETKEKIYD